MAAYEVAIVILVDRTGAVLMQHRDSFAPVAPDQWTVPGGRLEPGEAPESAARRETFEETGLLLDAPQLYWSGPRPYEEGFPHDVTVYLYCSPTGAVQDDVICGEGRAMMFVPRDDVLDRDIGNTCKNLLPQFLASSTYVELVRAAAELPVR